jgi:hypothetical protein
MIRLLLMALLTGFWVFVNLTFASWRVQYLYRKGGERVEPLKDWAVQVFYRVTALICLIVAICLAACSGE